MDDKFPYLGAVVWFVKAPNQIAPASVVGIGQFTTPDGKSVEAVRLRVDLLNGMEWHDAIQDELGKSPGTWHWPRPSRIQVAAAAPVNGKRVIG